MRRRSSQGAVGIVPGAGPAAGPAGTAAGPVGTAAGPAALGAGGISRRHFLALTGAGTLGLFLGGAGGRQLVHAVALPSKVLAAGEIPQFKTPLLIPPVMPRAGTITQTGGKNVDYYEIALVQFKQQMLPEGLPATTVWGYEPQSGLKKRSLLLKHAPSLTIEARADRPVRIKWINRLVDSSGKPLPHLLPVDPTLHWANPPGGESGRDTRPAFERTPDRYTGPVPMVTHLHGAEGVGDESDGYAEAWFLPDADIPSGYAAVGTWYDFLAAKSSTVNGAPWGKGYAVSQYPNSQRAGTLWFHDHTLGMTRLNVYAGPAGFYLLRGGPAGDAAVLDTRSGIPAILPSPAPRENDKWDPATLRSNKTYYEIPLAIQDRSFNEDGSLFYPDTRAFFDGIVGPYLPETMAGHHGFSPIWNPEFFGSSIIVNGRTWPTHDVEQCRYRFRVLNGCQSRFLVLDFSAIPGVAVWQIGTEGGFLGTPVDLTTNHANRLLMAPAERADLIVDFTSVPPGRYVLGNSGPDEPFRGDPDAAAADPRTTGRIMQFVVTGPPPVADPSTPPQFLALPAIAALPASTVTRPLALIEKMGMGIDADEQAVEGPTEAMLGTVGPDSLDSTLPAGVWAERMWMDPVTENPAPGATETWEFYNTTGDAHPMHIHEVLFRVVDREGLLMDGDEVVAPVALTGARTGPEPWEAGWKDTVIAYPGQVTRVQMTFRSAGQYVWHCHIVEHEDNEMMRPFRVGPVQDGQPGSG